MHQLDSRRSSGGTRPEEGRAALESNLLSVKIRDQSYTPLALSTRYRSFEASLYFFFLLLKRGNIFQLTKTSNL